MPLAVDQRYQAYRIHSTGTGVMIPPETFDQNLHTGIDKVINYPTYRSNARRTEIGEMPSADEVVPLIEQLANHGPPLPNR
jgi:UDP:flavonoid glycosyltransferase YjiC (YdhE family)